MKTGPFAEHSNQLWNISAVPSWSKVNQGLIRMYKAEVSGDWLALSVLGALSPRPPPLFCSWSSSELWASPLSHLRPMNLCSWMGSRKSPVTEARSCCPRVSVPTCQMPGGASQLCVLWGRKKGNRLGKRLYPLETSSKVLFLPLWCV